MNFEPNWKFSCDWLVIGRGDNSRENDGGVLSGHVDLLEVVGELANNSLHEVEISCAQSRPSIEDTVPVLRVMWAMGLWITMGIGGNEDEPARRMTS